MLRPLSATAALGLLAGIALAIVQWPGIVVGRAQRSLPALTLEGFSDVRTNGQDSTYGQGLTHRYVDGELRLLTLTLQRQLHEFRPAPLGETQTQTTGSWDLSNTGAFLHGFHGIWYEQAKDRLWITSAEDYTATNHPARVTLIELRSNGSVRVIKQFFLDRPAKRVYGGCNAVPAALVGSLGGAYVCGWGGYTSLVMQGGAASIGPTMYAIPDPDRIANGATVQARTILDTANAQTNRGVRLTIPQNYFDGGDPRQNPSTPPTGPPRASASWLSPNADGLGWMVWGDSYYNTGFWIGDTYGAIASLCKGRCWYQSSTLVFDDRQYELHLWDGRRLGSNALERPHQMKELQLPRGNVRGWRGNTPVGNIGGATYDERNRHLYLIGFALGSDDYTARLYRFRVDGGAGSPASPAVDAVVSEWSPWEPVTDWSDCTDGMQSRRERRKRTVVVPAANGGSTPALDEERTVRRFCGRPRPLTATPVADGLEDAVAVLPLPSAADTLVVVERFGRIRLVRDSAVQPADFLNLSGQVGTTGTGGLLGLAFAPDYATSRRAYVAFHDQSMNLVVARFTAGAGGQPHLDPATRFDFVWPDGRRVIAQPATSANGAALVFGADGYLYISIGSAGAGTVPPFVSQHPRSLLGKVLRLDVNVPLSDAFGYQIPPDNPWIDAPDVFPQIWAFGLRNARSLAFDVAAPGALLITDSGEAIQEISYVPAGTPRPNFGWPSHQGSRPHLSAVPTFAGTLIGAAWEYDGALGSAIAGGRVYRGAALGDGFHGRVVFGDAQSHRIWSARLDPASHIVDDLIDHSAELGSAAAAPTAFGVDAAGELLIITQSGSLYRVGVAGAGGRSGSGSAVGRARPRH
jgi:glucose/arabinose dehydrogenase